MTDASALPSAQREAAALRIKQREDAIRANAIKQGIDQERKRQEAGRNELVATHEAAMRGAQAAYEHASHKAHKHGHGIGLYKGVALGMCAGAALTVAVGSTLLLAGSRVSIEGMAAGNMIGKQNENRDRLRAVERNEPYAPQQQP